MGYSYYRVCCFVNNTEMDITGEELLNEIQYATKLKPEKPHILLQKG